MSKFDNSIFARTSFNLISFNNELRHRLLTESFLICFCYSFDIGFLSFATLLVIAFYTLFVVRIIHIVNRSHCRSHFEQE